MLEKSYVFERQNGAVGVMLHANAAQKMLDEMNAVGWRGTIDCWTTTVSINGGAPELPAVIKLSPDRKLLEVVRLVSSVEK